MRASLRWAWVTCCVPWTLAVACGTSGDASKGKCSVSGTLLGSSFDAQDCTIFTTGHAGAYATDLVITDFSGACGVVAENSVKAHSKVIDAHFGGVSSLTTGTYAVGSNGIDAQFVTFDATCNSPTGESGGGTILVTQASPSISGTFDLYFNADHVTGSFDVTSCSPAPTDGAVPCL